MTCEHCGTPVDPAQNACPECGVSLEPARRNSSPGKVIPFRPRLKATKKRVVPPKQYRTRTWWWVAAIVVVSILVPYLFSAH
ncbi:MAG: hypothetical protein ACYCT0_08710 [Sulfobacillus sp.]